MAAASRAPVKADYLSADHSAGVVVKTEFMDNSGVSSIKTEYLSNNSDQPINIASQYHSNPLLSVHESAVIMKTEYTSGDGCMAIKTEVNSAIDEYNNGGGAMTDASAVNGHRASGEVASTSGVDEEGQIDIQVRNVVCTFSLPLHIDLRRVALHAGNVSYDKGQGVLMKQKRNPSCYVKVYSSGKVYIVGCRSEVECRKAARGVARMIQIGMGRKGEMFRMRKYRICNIMATCKMPFGIKIEEMHTKYKQHSQYEPELSVGLVWRSKEPKGTMRIHTTGSITVTGALSEEAVMQMIEMIYPIVNEFKCPLRARDPKTSAKAAAPDETAKRKRPPAAARPRAPKRPRPVEQPASGVYGNSLYFSEEDDFYEELDEADGGEL
uniref:TATA box-binding protein-like 1 n=1 Tax=Plectus sambesii TaxID=2011161 RepID=A0A914WTM3_9BILA